MPVPSAVQHEILRPRLHLKLSSFRKPVLLVFAPGGYGKTVTVAQWLRTQNSPALWLENRQLSTSSTQLLRILMQGLRDCQATPSQGTTDPSFEEVIHQLHLLQHLPLKIVLDSMQGYDRDALRVISRLARHLDPAHQLVICSRSPRIDGLQQLFAKQMVDLVTASDLAFTPEESRQVLGDGFTLDIHQEHQGWCLGITGMQDHHLIFDPSAYFDELSAELDSTALQIMRKMAHLESWTEKTLEPAVTLWEVLESGLPLLPLNLRTYRLHPLLRSWLIEHAKQEDSIPTDDFDVEVTEHLVRKMLSRGRMEELKVLLERTCKDWLNHDMFEPTVKVLNLLKPADLSPVLRTFLAEAHLELGRLELAEQQLLNQIHAQMPISRTFLNLARIASRRERMDEFRLMLDRAWAVAMNDEDRVWTSCQEVYYHLRLGQLEKAREIANSSVTLARTTGQPELIIVSYCRLAYCDRMLLRAETAISNTQAAMSFAVAHKLVNKAASAMNTLADLQKDLGQYPEALETVTRAITEMQTYHHSYEGILYSTRGLIFMETGKNREALMDFQESLRLLRLHGNYFGALLPYAFMCFVVYRMRHPEQLNTLFEEYQELVHTTPSCQGTDGYLNYFPLAKAIFHCSNGKLKLALEALDEVTIHKSNSWLDSILLMQLFRCKIKHQLGTLSETDADVLVRILESRDSAIILSMYHRDFREPLDALIRQGWHATRLEQWIHQTPPELEVVQKIHLNVLEKPQLWVAGRETRGKGNYPIMVLLYLHLNRGQHSTSLRMAQDLWDSASKNRLHPALSMLRTQLRGVDALFESLVITNEKGYILNEQFQVTSDLDPYLAPQKLPTLEQVQLLRDLPRDFFGFVESGWAEDLREQVRQNMADISLRVARQRLQEGQLTEACHLVEQGLRIDPHNFELMAQLIEIARLGEWWDKVSLWEATLGNLLQQH